MASKSYIILGTVLLLSAMVLQYESATPLANDHNSWMLKYNKQYYSLLEQEYRRQVFERNVKLVEETNKKQTDFVLEINEFADLTQEEFSIKYLQYDHQISNQQTQQLFKDGQDLNQEIDWSKYAGSVRNQGQCAGYIFNVLDLLDANNKIIKNNQNPLSQQDLIDCSGSYGNQGCQGGFISGTLNYVKDKGLAYEKDYPTTQTSGVCKNVQRTFRISSYITVNNCDDLIKALSNSTVTVAVDATSWQFYKGGVLTQCGSSLNHNALLTGVTNDGVWTLKNTWGTSWGEKGFIRLGAGNTCGVCKAGSQQVF
ncbi:unnamed protein product (macronuclear) [Paramecium tetraurelia]|uniref:Papain family cysteine protease n=1 Tax=Paramecium tetraurelia TaxID=5888 RepID=A0CHZ5_PARTE|nr:uncharacterized protein GSPATT00038514001 [Paramecium tetraurelia]CAK70412.1 unnamed protein product [Paramecium tetraurelia]|eukprot:XP_001437809.1 hypothetical protein (macronuclear) [Paramecium tetraurelia strain d4-2]